MENILCVGVTGFVSFVFLQIVTTPVSTSSETISHLFFSVLLAAFSQLVIKFGNKWIDQLKFKRSKKLPVTVKQIKPPEFDMY